MKAAAVQSQQMVVIFSAKRKGFVMPRRLDFTGMVRYFARDYTCAVDYQYGEHA